MRAFNGSSCKWRLYFPEFTNYRDDHKIKAIYHPSNYECRFKFNPSE